MNIKLEELNRETALAALAEARSQRMVRWGDRLDADTMRLAELTKNLPDLDYPAYRNAQVLDKAAP